MRTILIFVYPLHLFWLLLSWLLPSWLLPSSLFPSWLLPLWLLPSWLLSSCLLPSGFLPSWILPSWLPPSFLPPPFYPPSSPLLPSLQRTPAKSSVAHAATAPNHVAGPSRMAPLAVHSIMAPVTLPTALLDAVSASLATMPPATSSKWTLVSVPHVSHVHNAMPRSWRASSTAATTTTITITTM